MTSELVELDRISDYPAYWAARHPEREAVVLDDIRWSYAELARQVDLYARALWARELLKGPDLILAVIAGPLDTPPGAALLSAVLAEYLAGAGAAAVLVGESLEAFYPLGRRLLRLESGQFLKPALLEHRPHPLTDYLPLV